MKRALPVFLFCIIYCANTFGFEWSGHVKYTFNYLSNDDDSLAYAFIGDSLSSHLFNTRLNVKQDIEHLSLVAHYELFAFRTNGFSPSFANLDDKRLWDLTDDINENSKASVVQRLDRLYAAYHMGDLFFKLGRQAVSWGNGFLFHPMDIFNPFDPVALDKEYKQGDDMFYSQYTTTGGDDWQFIALPRRNPFGEVDSNYASLALKYHSISAFGDFDVLIAEHFGDNVIGLGYSKQIGESIWRFDFTKTRSKNETSVNSFITNLDYSWVTNGTNYYGYVEYFYNGFGHNTLAEALDPSNIALGSRISRGDLYTYLKNYLATGFSIELHPLVVLGPGIVLNLDDHSLLAPVSLTYNWKENLELKLSLVLSNGKPDSEYGGATSPGDSVNFQLARYF